MIKVWILIIMLNGDARGFSANGVVAIDNIASKSECERVLAHTKYMESENKSNQCLGTFRCIEVWKVKQ